MEGGALLRALFLYSAACTSMIEVIGALMRTDTVIGNSCRLGRPMSALDVSIETIRTEPASTVLVMIDGFGHGRSVHTGEEIAQPQQP